MAGNKLQDWLRNTRAKGLSEAEISNMLIKRGYTAKQARAALGESKKGKSILYIIAGLIVVAAILTGLYFAFTPPELHELSVNLTSVDRVEVAEAEAWRGGMIACDWNTGVYPEGEGLMFTRACRIEKIIDIPPSLQGKPLAVELTARGTSIDLTSWYFTNTVDITGMTAEELLTLEWRDAPTLRITHYDSLSDQTQVYDVTDEDDIRKLADGWAYEQEIVGEFDELYMGAVIEEFTAEGSTISTRHQKAELYNSSYPLIEVGLGEYSESLLIDSPDWKTYRITAATVAEAATLSVAFLNPNYLIQDEMILGRELAIKQIVIKEVLS